MAGLQFKHSCFSIVLVLSKHQMSLEGSYEYQGTVAITKKISHTNDVRSIKPTLQNCKRTIIKREKILADIKAG